MSIAITIISGNLGHDPELRFLLNSGKAVTNFNVATSVQWKDADGNKKEETTWYRVNVFGPAAENCAKFLKKGDYCTVTGRCKASAYIGTKGENEGKAIGSLELFADKVDFGPKGGGGRATEQPPWQRDTQAETSYDDSGTPDAEGEEY